MNNHQQVVEIAIFTVKPEFRAKMPAIREQMRPVINQFPGLLEYRDYSPVEEGGEYADIAIWDSLENARAAAEAFEKGDERFLPYFEAIESGTFMSHFKP